MAYKNIVILICASAFGLNDLTLVGDIKFNDGLARQPIWIIENLANDLNINWLKKSGNWHRDHFFKKVEDVVSANDHTLGNIIFYTDHLWFYKTKINQSNKIKIASSMFDADIIPTEWVEILNADFDAVVVPDNYHVETYINSGVKIPIFVLPLGLFLDEFLVLDFGKKTKKVFTFGNTCSMPYRKNHIRLLEGFAAAFGNNSNVRLAINSRGWEEDALKKFQNKLNQLGLENVDFCLKPLSSNEYVDFMSSIDCYVSTSAGEGFAITPREALAMGCPVILTNNTAHKTICDSGFVRTIRSDLPIRAHYQGFPEVKGNFFDCEVSDVKNALLDVYNNYDYYLNIAMLGKEWVKNYTALKLKSKYLSLFKPKKIILGHQNEIYDDCLITNSLKLYEKYKTLIGC